MRYLLKLAACGGLLLINTGHTAVTTPALDPAMGARFAALALDCVQREYPNKIAHVLHSDADVAPPRALTPAFYGCFDWHSSVHGHWLLVRLGRLMPDAEFAVPAQTALVESLTAENIEAEVAYLSAPGRGSFERPYGLAWLLQLAAELREWGPPGAELSANLAPLETRAAAEIANWLPKLSYPIRVGEHAQTAFAMGLILDWAQSAGDVSMADLVRTRSKDYYLADRDCPLAYEPSGQDFLSPCLAEADLMRRVLDPSAYAQWLSGFLPGIPPDGDGGWMRPEQVTDPTDGKLAHLDGLNLSRAWMLEGMSFGLPADDPRRASILASAAAHTQAGLASVTGEHYEGGHWLGSFATYLVTQRGIDSSARPPGPQPASR